MIENLEQLDHEAGAIDAETERADNPQFENYETIAPPSLNMNYKPAILQFLSFAVGLADKKITFTSRYFDQATLETIADNIVNVADVEGLDLEAMLGNPNSRLGAWLALATVVGMPSFLFYLAIKETQQPKEKTINTSPGETSSGESTPSNFATSFNQ